MTAGNHDETAVPPQRPPAHDRLSQESASAVVADLADRAGLPAPKVRWRKGYSSTLGSRGTFVLGHDLRGDPERFAAVVGHFLGHVGVRNLRLSVTLNLIVDLWFAVIAAIAMSFVLYGPGPSVWLRLPACLLLPVINGFFLAGMARLRHQAIERQADTWRPTKPYRTSTNNGPQV